MWFLLFAIAVQSQEPPRIVTLIGSRPNGDATDCLYADPGADVGYLLTTEPGESCPEVYPIGEADAVRGERLLAARQKLKAEQAVSDAAFREAGMWFGRILGLLLLGWLARWCWKAYIRTPRGGAV
jgi:hypothetical protein